MSKALEDDGDENDTVASSSSRETKKLSLRVVDCAQDGSLAALCIRLTGSFTVPHVFFNDVYVGDATAFFRMVDKSSGSLPTIYASGAASAGEAEEEAAPLCNERLAECPMYAKVALLARKPDPDPPFPPPSAATIVKLTERVAFSSQPTRAQLGKLRAFGINGVLNLLKASSPVFMSGELATLGAQGVAYTHHELHVINEVSVLRAVDALRALIKRCAPVLVHDDCGVRAALVVSVHAALLMNEADPGKVDASTVLSWGKDLGVELDAHEQVVSAIVSPKNE